MALVAHVLDVLTLELLLMLASKVFRIHDVLDSLAAQACLTFSSATDLERTCSVVVMVATAVENLDQLVAWLTW